MSKVMLVEDDLTMLSLLGTLMEMEGFQVIKHSDETTVEELLDTLRQQQPDVVLMDIHIHQINGMDVVRIMRQEDDLRQIRVLMSSGMDHTEECLAAGADGFMLKPFMPDDLISRMRKMIDQS